MAKRTIAVVATGGTIACRDTGGGAVPQLSGADLLRLVGVPADLPTIEVIEFARLPGCEMTPRRMAELAQVVTRELAHEDCCGAVVTHGTDTIDESAFVCHLTVPPDKPVVFTGSLRNASDLSWDGPRNLLDALRVAAAPAAQGLGTALVINEEIHAARFVIKSNGLLLGAFQSPACGPVGRIYGGTVRFVTRPLPPVRRLEPALDEAVAVVRALSGDTLSLTAILARPELHGLVVEGFGSGRVPAAWAEPLHAAVQRGIAVVLASRTGAGMIGDPYGYAGSATNLLALGLIPAHELPGHKVRLQLMLALGNRLHGAALRACFERGYDAC
ncbi:MAG TPA: asparaginase [Candidatus Margulisiibacteriota bacterium]|nr:asparaginase [Candidatus Margulisiibacteriota bacterium]